MDSAVAGGAGVGLDVAEGFGKVLALRMKRQNYKKRKNYKRSEDRIRITEDIITKGRTLSKVKRLAAAVTSIKEPVSQNFSTHANF